MMEVIRALKIVFILGLLLTYLVWVLQPSISRFLSFSVTVEVNTVSQARKNIQKSTRQCAFRNFLHQKGTEGLC